MLTLLTSHVSCFTTTSCLPPTRTVCDHVCLYVHIAWSLAFICRCLHVLCCLSVHHNYLWWFCIGFHQLLQFTTTIVSGSVWAAASYRCLPQLSISKQKSQHSRLDCSCLQSRGQTSEDCHPHRLKSSPTFPNF